MTRIANRLTRLALVGMLGTAVAACDPIPPQDRATVGALVGAAAGYAIGQNPSERRAGMIYGVAAGTVVGAANSTR